jgi:hypothetical protein
VQIHALPKFPAAPTCTGKAAKAESASSSSAAAAVAAAVLAQVSQAVAELERKMVQEDPFAQLDEVKRLEKQLNTLT